MDENISDVAADQVQTDGIVSDNSAVDENISELDIAAAPVNNRPVQSDIPNYIAHGKICVYHPDFDYTLAIESAQATPEYKSTYDSLGDVTYREIRTVVDLCCKTEDANSDCPGDTIDYTGDNTESFLASFIEFEQYAYDTSVTPS